jgi:hypothetical protein
LPKVHPPCLLVCNNRMVPLAVYCYGNEKNTATRKWRWLEELRQERERISK